MRTKASIIHTIAHCRNCDWKDEDFIFAARNAVYHSKSTGHIIDVEQGKHYVVHTSKTIMI